MKYGENRKSVLIEKYRWGLRLSPRHVTQKKSGKIFLSYKSDILNSSLVSELGDSI